MDKDTFIQLVQEIGTCESDVDRRTKLTNLQDEVSKIYDEMETDKTTINTLNETIKTKDSDIEALQKANMDYFTRLSSQNNTTQSKDLTPDDGDDHKRKFEDLFNEKGRLKL